MKTKNKLTKIVCTALAAFACFFFGTAGIVLPKKKAEAGPITIMTAIGVIGKVGGVVAAINHGLKFIRALEYGHSHNAEDNFQGVWESTTDYLSGNIGPDDNGSDVDAEKLALYTVNEIDAAMKEYFAITNDSIAQLKSSVVSLNTTISDLAKEFDNDRINEFYNYYYNQSTILNSAHDSLNKQLSTNQNEVTVKAAYDSLYNAAKDLNNLKNYITGVNNVNAESILEIYCRYVDPSASNEALENCVDFVLELYQADSLQRYCQALCLLYQMGIYERDTPTRPSDAVNGYVGSNFTVFSTDFTDHLKEIRDGQAKVAAAVAKKLYELCGCKDTIGYVEKGEHYEITPNENGSYNAYSGSQLMLNAMPDELLPLFDYGFTFASSSEGITVSENGVIDITAESGTFDVSLVYGQDDLETPLPVSTISFTIVDRPYSGGGYGTRNAPYLIANSDDLRKFNDIDDHTEDDAFRLVNDVEVTWSWRSIDYWGYFDGGGYTITKLNAPFVNQNVGMITNLTIDSAEITTNRMASGILAVYNYNRISNCHVNNSTITNDFTSSIYLKSTVTPDRFRIDSTKLEQFNLLILGGICGANHGWIWSCSTKNNKLNGELENSEVSPSAGSYVFHNEAYVGGIVGYNGGFIQNCRSASNKHDVSCRAFCRNFSSIKVTASSNVCYGGIVGYSYSGELTNNISTYFPAAPDHLFISSILNADSYGGAYGTYEGHAESRNLNSVYGYNYNNNTTLVNNFGTFEQEGVLHHRDATEEQIAEMTKSGWTWRYDWNWNAPYPPELDGHITSIEIKSLPTKRTYEKDEPINTAGLALKANVYPSCLGFTIYQGYTVSPVDTSTYGEKTVTVNYLGRSVSYTINVECSHRGTKVITEGTPPAPGVPGLTMGITCSECGAVIAEQREIPALDRDEYAEPTWTWSSGAATATFVCLNDDSKTQTIAAKTSYEVLTAPTCTEAGLANFIATVEFNGETYTDILPAYPRALGHEVIEAVTIEPTCTTEGKTAGSYCGRCDETLSGMESIPATGHTYGEPIWSWSGRIATATFTCVNNGAHTQTIAGSVTTQIITTPSCTENGSYSHTATVTFGEDTYTTTTTEAVPASGHDIVIDAAVPVTCTSVGLTAGSHCSVCHTILESQTLIPSTGHDYNLSHWTWNESNNATAHFVCTLDSAHVKNISAIVIASIAFPATCTAEGERTYSATVIYEDQQYNNYKTVAIPKTAHTPVTDRRVEPTCTESGLTAGSHCGACNAALQMQESISPLGHEYSTPRWQWKSGYIAEATFVCQRNITHVETPAVTVTSAITTPAGCLTDGVRTYTATTSFGGELYTNATTEKIIATGHTPVVDAAIPSTCTQAGKSEGSHCGVCNVVLTAQEALPLAEHTPVTVGAIPSTCTEAGMTAGSQCSVCNTVLTAQEALPLAEHTLGEWTVTLAPTVETEGKEALSCSVCGNVLDERVLPVLPPEESSNEEDGCGSVLHAGWLSILPLAAFALLRKQKESEYEGI